MASALSAFAFEKITQRRGMAAHGVAPFVLSTVLVLSPLLILGVMVSDAIPAPAAPDVSANLPPCGTPVRTGYRRPGLPGPPGQDRIIITDRDQLALVRGARVRLGDILFADRMPDMTDRDRERIRVARENGLQAIFADRDLFGCALVPKQQAAPDRDRYGRRFVDAVGGGKAFSLRRHMVAEGLALVLPTSSDAGCCAGLYRAEARARTLKKGIWGTDTPLIRRIDPGTGTVDLPESAFAIVEGWVRSVGDREREIYLNFGHRWASDFTATIKKSSFSGTQADLKRLVGLAGKRVRVRGVADSWRGGRIAVNDANQLEVLTPSVRLPPAAVGN